MAKRSVSNLAPTALGRLVEGMTPREVEGVVGRYHRPNLYECRRYYAWIGDGGMLRAFFEGSAETLSKVVLDVAEEQRVLALRGSLRQRIKNCTVIRTWNCIKCRKRFRCSALPPLACPNCGDRCEHVPSGMKVPCQDERRLGTFWSRYKAEQRCSTHTAGELRESVVEIFGPHLKPKAPATEGVGEPAVPPDRGITVFRASTSASRRGR